MADILARSGMIGQLGSACLGWVFVGKVLVRFGDPAGSVLGFWSGEVVGIVALVVLANHWLGFLPMLGHDFVPAVQRDSWLILASSLLGLVLRFLFWLRFQLLRLVGIFTFEIQKF